jgi:hypothetical protein
MLHKTKLPYTRLFAFLLAVFIAIGALFSSVTPVHAADGTIDFHAGPSIAYGDYFTSRMTFDGSNTAYCVEPLKHTPPSGTYSYNLLEKTSPLRKALYYLNGGYGYDTVTKEKYFQGWSDDNAYVIGHLAVAYIYAGNTGDTGAFHGAPQSFIDKTLEVVQGISELPAPPENFRAFLVPGSGNQTFAGSWYQVPNGWIELQKSSANPSISDGNGNYTLEGAKYGIYKGDKLIQTLTTDKNGYAKSKELEEGSYTVKEISAPAGFIVDATAHDVNVKPEETSTVKSSDIPQNNPISLILQKLDLETGEGKPQGNSSLANAEFTIKFYTELSDTDPAASGKKPVRTWVMKTNASGEMHFTKDYFVSGDEFYYASDKKTVCLPIGTVTIQETKAPKNYFLNETVFVQKITGSGSQESVSIYNASNVEEQVYRGGVKVQKRDLETQDTVSQGNATLAGATFSITTLNEQPVWVNGKLYQKDEMCLTIITDENGLASTEEKALPVGHYRIEETQAPTGYLKDGAKTLEFEIPKDGEMVDLTSKDTSIANQVIRGGVKVQKRDIETGETKPQGNATLEGATFTITNLSTHPVLVNEKLYESGQVVLTLKTDKSGAAVTAKDALPYGHYRIDETEAPDGYLNEGKLSQEFDIQENGKIIDLTSKEHAILNQIIRGDLEFVKVSDGDLNRLANVPFSITSKTTGESHTIVTDKNGYASTSAEWNKHTANTNRGETSEDGIWFGTSKPDDSKGALIYDTYTLAEQRCDSNKGMDLLTFEVKVYKDSVLIQVGTLTDDAIEIGTTALDAETGTHMSQPAKEVTIEDVVEYEGLKKGQKYKLTGTLMDKKTGEPILVDEKPVISETEFTAKKSSGSVKVTFTFDATSLKGKTTVVFEELYQDEMQLAVHTDINDEDQTIYFPEIKTTAKDADTNSNISCAKEEITLVDTVSFKGLVPNQKYEVTGTLIDKETKKPVEADGKPVTAKASFKPKESAGTVDVTFTFDASSLKGKTVVVFESLAYKDKEVAVHTDIADEGQTIYFPEIKTTATDAASGTHYAKPEKELTLTDLVEYKNLIPGKEYKLTGTLMDAETEKPFDVDGKAVTAETSFTPEEANGSVELSFTFDASALSGKTLVAFETMTFEDHEVAVHADIKDANQTIYFPEIKTTAKDGSDGDQDVSASKEATIVDTVTYHGLMPGSEYKVIGTLMNKETGEALLKDGKPVTAQAEFKAEKAGGSVEVTFTFDASALAGQDVVVFEKLYYTDGKTEHEIASHEDLKDEGQTVHMTELPKEPETPPVAPPVKTGDETPLLLYAGIAIAALAGASVLGIVYFKRKKKHQ